MKVFCALFCILATVFAQNEEPKLSPEERRLENNRINVFMDLSLANPAQVVTDRFGSSDGIIHIKNVEDHPAGFKTVEIQMQPLSVVEEAKENAEEEKASNIKKANNKPSPATMEIMKKLLEDKDIVAISQGKRKRGIVFNKETSDEVKAKFKLQENNEKSSNRFADKERR